jgi:hypothetical protein
MMKFMKKAIAFAVMAVAAMSSQAATQGDASATQSVGTFNVSFGSAPVARTIRVFGLTDIAVAAGGTGQSAQFCVADSTGGAVRVVLSSPTKRAPGSNLADAFDAVTGVGLPYWNNWGLIGSVGDNDVVVVPAGSTTTDTANCTVPNMAHDVFLANGAVAPTGAIHTNVVTYTATPQ